MASVGGHGNPAVLWLARLEEVIQLTIRMGVLPWAQGGKGQWEALAGHALRATKLGLFGVTSVCVCGAGKHRRCRRTRLLYLSLIHISEPTRRTPISYAVFCLKKKKKTKK